MAPISMTFDCFKRHDSPKAHYYSARQLHSRGVWVGYLAPAKHQVPFEGMHSFYQLKENWEAISLPHPPLNLGSLGGDRQAVCGGCFSSQSALLTLRDITFVNNTSLVIMPLDGEDEEGMFCILIPVNMGRAFKGLQAYRPYEVGNGGDGKSFENNFMIFTHQKSSNDVETIDHIRDILTSAGLVEAARYSELQPTDMGGKALIHKQSTEGVHNHSPKTPEKRKDNEIDREDKRGMHTRTDTEVLMGTQTHRQAGTIDTINPSTLSNTDTSREQSTSSRLSMGELNLHSRTASPVAVTSSTLTAQQAQNIHFVWSIRDGDLDYELIHTLAECNSFQQLLDVLREDARSISTTATRLANTRRWCMTLLLPGGNKKAFIASQGVEVVYSRLRSAIAELGIWNEDVDAVIDVKLEPRNNE